MILKHAFTAKVYNLYLKFATEHIFQLFTTSSAELSFILAATERLSSMDKGEGLR